MSLANKVRRYPHQVRDFCLAVGIVMVAWLVAANAGAQQTPPSPDAAEPAAPSAPMPSGEPMPEPGEGEPAPAAPPAATPSPATSPSVPTGAESPAAPAGQPRDFDPRDDIRRSSGLYGDITHVGLRRFLVLITAFLIGTAGAAAFHLGVYAGFIARESRPGVLEFLHTEFLNRTSITQREKSLTRTLRIAFWCFGGIVAVVFQMADADSLVPIQAFVLGASWPTVVTQLMSGRSAPPPPQRASIIPETPPAPTGGGTTAEVAGGGGRSVEVIS